MHMSQDAKSGTFKDGRHRQTALFTRGSIFWPRNFEMQGRAAGGPGSGVSQGAREARLPCNVGTSALKAPGCQASTVTVLHRKYAKPNKAHTMELTKDHSQR